MDCCHHKQKLQRLKETQHNHCHHTVVGHQEKIHQFLLTTMKNGSNLLFCVMVEFKVWQASYTLMCPGGQPML